MIVDKAFKSLPVIKRLKVKAATMDCPSSLDVNPKSDIDRQHKIRDDTGKHRSIGNHRL